MCSVSLSKDAGQQQLPHQSVCNHEENCWLLNGRYVCTVTRGRSVFWFKVTSTYLHGFIRKQPIVSWGASTLFTFWVKGEVKLMDPKLANKSWHFCTNQDTWLAWNFKWTEWSTWVAFHTWERERQAEMEKERETERQRERERDRVRDRQRDRQTETERN